MVTWSEFQQAFADASRTMEQADSVAGNLAHILAGRLRKVTDTSVLAKLKRELRDFNIHTGAWTDEK